MFSKVLQVGLFSTSLSPVLLVFWFKEFSKEFNFTNGLFYLIVAVGLLIFLKLLLNMAKEKLEVWQLTSLEITEISSMSSQKALFILLYLVPLLENNTYLLWFWVVLVFTIIYRTNTYYFNPTLSLLGYKQYKVKLKSGLIMVLITKKVLVNSEQVKEVVRLSEYVLLETKTRMGNKVF